LDGLSRQWVAGRAILRFALGVSQMTAAAFALGLLLVGGVTSGALAASAIACTLTTVSVLLFGRKGPTE
jgi:hypothetical protein